jgi:hypothetical protein
MYYFRSVTAVGICIALSGCGTEPLICTQELVGVSVAVINGAGQPLDALSVTDTVKRTGAVLHMTSALAPPEVPIEGGHAIVFSDDFIEEVRRGGDDVVVVMTAGGRVTSSVFRFGSNGCHVQKIAGPDSLVIS